jgi:hypothetical protein
MFAQNFSLPPCRPALQIAQNKWLVYIYVDGNNNAWHIGESQIKYQPITPTLSGSGIYSGGSHRVGLESSFSNFSCFRL